jgi:hypothetical protein
MGMFLSFLRIRMGLMISHRSATIVPILISSVEMGRREESLGRPQIGHTGWDQDGASVVLSDNQADVIVINAYRCRVQSIFSVFAELGIHV